MKVRVLIAITGGIKRDGINTITLSYLENMNKEELSFDIVSGTIDDPVVEVEYQQLDCGVICLSNRKKSPLKYMKELYSLISKEKYDVMHAMGSSSLLSIELGLAKIAGIENRIAHSRNTACMYKKSNIILKPLFNSLYTKGLACSKEAGKWLFGKKSFDVLPNGLKIESYRFNPEIRCRIRKDLEVENKYVIGHVGRFNKTKNHPFLLDIFEVAAGKKPELVLLLIGGGPDHDTIADRINKSKYKERIIMYGEASDISQLYSAMDIFVFPSLYEGFGNVLLEAQINSLRCLISDKIPKEVFVTNQINVLPLDSPVNWANKIVSSLPEKRKDNLSSIDLEKFMEYDIKSNGKKLESMYLEMGR